jgi:hypothetical protein
VRCVFVRNDQEMDRKEEVHSSLKFSTLRTILDFRVRRVAGPLPQEGPKGLSYCDEEICKRASMNEGVIV